MNRPLVLECQTCGTVLRRLTVDEARQVAADPYRFMVDCERCFREFSPYFQG